MNDLRSQSRTLAPVEPGGPKTGEVVATPKAKRLKSDSLFESSRPVDDQRLAGADADQEVDETSAAGQAGHGDESDPGAGTLSFPVSRDVRSMALSGSDVETNGQAGDGESAEAGRQGQGRRKSKAPASRPTRRREVADELDPEDDKFPWHYQFNDDEPLELKAKTPLLSRAFRSSVG